MPTHFQRDVSHASESPERDAPPAAAGNCKERELARRSDLLLAENAAWVARNHDKLVAETALPDGAGPSQSTSADGSQPKAAQCSS
jgi:hypothetical protein